MKQLKNLLKKAGEMVKKGSAEDLPLQIIIIIKLLNYYISIKNG
jgi:hypothetical protein